MHIFGVSIEGITNWGCCFRSAKAKKDSENAPEPSAPSSGTQEDLPAENNGCKETGESALIKGEAAAGDSPTPPEPCGKREMSEAELAANTERDQKLSKRQALLREKESWRYRVMALCQGVIEVTRSVFES